MRSFDELVAEADQVPVDGWDFSWLDGRATEERPPWAYARTIASRLTRARAALHLQTGGGEGLGRRGVVVPGHDGVASLPFADGSFDLITSRHPVSTDWVEIARVLTPG